MKRNKTFVIKVPNHGELEDIDFDRVRMDADSFVVTVQASSSSEDTLAGRRQAITELTQAGYISPEVSEEMLTSSNPDTSAMNKREQAQRRYLEKLIARFQEYEAVEERKGEDDDDADEMEEPEDMADEMVDTDDDNPFEPPDPALNLDAAIIQMSEGYWETKCDGAPEENLQLFRDWISLADKEIEKRQAAAAPPPPPPAPPGAQMMGDPALGMPPPEAMPPGPMPM